MISPWAGFEPTRPEDTSSQGWRNTKLCDHGNEDFIFHKPGVINPVNLKEKFIYKYLEK